MLIFSFFPDQEPDVFPNSHYHSYHSFLFSLSLLSIIQRCDLYWKRLYYGRSLGIDYVKLASLG